MSAENRFEMSQARDKELELLPKGLSLTLCQLSKEKSCSKELSAENRLEMSQAQDKEIELLPKGLSLTFYQL